MEADRGNSSIKSLSDSGLPGVGESQINTVTDSEGPSGLSNLRSALDSAATLLVQL